MTRPSPLRVLAVCTGNIGRSPMMERILRRDLEVVGLSGQVVVGSAGTWAREGQPMETFAEQVLRERGADVSAFGARPLGDALVEEADLILTATREHRAAVAALVPAAVRRTFTLLELARLVAAAPAHTSESADKVAAMQASIAWIAQHRSSADGHGDDLDDPLGAPLTVYRRRADQIESSSARVTELLAR